MSDDGKQLSNSYSTGGGGVHFENRVQASFVVLMLTGGYAPCLPTWPITEVKFQGKYQGFGTDDLIVHVRHPDRGTSAKLLGQIKRSIKMTNGDKVFGEVIQAAWSDFNNKSVFSQNTDVIALITGPLSAVDTENVRSLLRQAEYSADADDFMNRIALGKFTSKQQRAKLEVFKTHLKKANKNVGLTDDQIWRFLKSFRLLIYDLDIKGVILSLVHSLIGYYSSERAEALLARIEQEITYNSENAGRMTTNSISEDIRSEFLVPTRRSIPDDFIVLNQTVNVRDWNSHKHASSLVFVNMLGSWSENNSADINLIAELVGEDYREWISKIRELLQEPQSPVNFNNGIWGVNGRKELWRVLGSRIFDDMLDQFKKFAVTVLVDRDPKFEFSPEERFAAKVHGKTLTYSEPLRRGICETLALLGNQNTSLVNCSMNRRESIARLVVHETFRHADWVLWGTLNGLLPTLAEAAPEEFLSAVESALYEQSCPLDELYLQEGNGFSGENYLTGLLWALESLAWDEQYLVRVSAVLGDLARRDPGGTSANRPANSLTTIFLPWFPQTNASIDKRKVAVTTVCEEAYEVGWRLLLTLLPNQRQTSSGSHRPKWYMDVPEDWPQRVTGDEYWKQISIYSEMLYGIARNDIDKLTELVNYLDHLLPKSIDTVLELLLSEDIKDRPEMERLGLWNALKIFTLRHKRFADAKWALDADSVVKLEEAANVLAPKNPMYLHRLIFSNNEAGLFEETGDWEAQRKRLESHRQQAMRDVVAYGGVHSIFEFAKTVESSTTVGYTLGTMSEMSSIDPLMLPDLLTTQEKYLEHLSSAFIWGRYQTQGWSWVDNIKKDTWSKIEIGKFLCSLPFAEETWKRVNTLLGDAEATYWISVNVNPYQPESSMEVAIDKLLEHRRPNAAISCLYKTLYDMAPLDINRTTNALLQAVSSAERMASTDTYHIVQLIKALQNTDEMNGSDLFQIEWAYLPLLDGYHDGVRPNTLEHHLSSEPNFFSEVIRLVYRSKEEIGEERKLTDHQKAVAENAYRLLHEWRTPPGTQSDGSFVREQFVNWLEQTKMICIESGHLEVAFSHVGNVLIYSPADPNGLWIDHTVAAALNAKDAKKLRDGYYVGVLNSRGVHFVDPTGSPERELAIKYRNQANEVEDAGFQRFAITLRELARSYELEAERIVAEHKSDTYI